MSGERMLVKLQCRHLLKLNGFSVLEKSYFFSLAEGLFSSQEQLCSFELHNYVLRSEVLYYLTLITLYNTNYYHPEYIRATNCNCFPIIFCL